ncbi:glycosyltransferase family 2 protein [Croceicoccus bisphenolivorans]|uniref:glycosyltransferase family 2 protein n=1 Tax=Croceicoccus bisphenolivorans TaxID=1783232 RepID=UPI00082D71D3|nr:glycosyltransferase family 2 protein [Croceicoccus bisphenolivorans]
MRWTVVIPVFNERDFLPATLDSLARQTTSFQLLIVDNGSTDGCMDDAREIVARQGMTARFLHEPMPGQVHALKRGIDQADSELIAICDADTYYPPDYLQQAERLFDAGGQTCVAAAALLLPEPGNRWRTQRAIWHKYGALRLMPRQNHTSGAAQCFRLQALRAAGGYDPQIWPYVLKDHELMHRVLMLGTQACSKTFWCVSSDRRTSRRNVRWTLAERLAYHLIPFSRKSWFFSDFLAPRFAARALGDTVLRQRDWEATEVPT